MGSTVKRPVNEKKTTLIRWSHETDALLDQLQVLAIDVTGEYLSRSLLLERIVRCAPRDAVRFADYLTGETPAPSVLADGQGPRPGPRPLGTSTSAIRRRRLSADIR